MRVVDRWRQRAHDTGLSGSMPKLQPNRVFVFRTQSLLHLWPNGHPGSRREQSVETKIRKLRAREKDCNGTRTTLNSQKRISMIWKILDCTRSRTKAVHSYCSGVSIKFLALIQKIPLSSFCSSLNKIVVLLTVQKIV